MASVTDQSIRTQGIVYLRTTNSNKAVHVSLVMAKTRVVPIKTISQQGLQLCGAVITAEFLDHCKVLGIPLSDMSTCTDSTVVLRELQGNLW